MHHQQPSKSSLLPARLLAGVLLLVACMLGVGALNQASPAAAQAPGTPPPLPAGVLLRVQYDGDAQLAALAAAYDIWEVNRQQGYALVFASDQERAALQAAGFQAVEDGAGTAAFVASLPRFPTGDVGAASASTIPNYACYRTVEETYTVLADLATARPDLARWLDIGDSWEKTQPGGAAGYDLHVLVLTNRDRPGPKPRFFLAAATHARELATAELATRFAEYLVRNYGVDPDVTWLLDYNELHLVAHANPDGRKLAEAGSAWRKNTNASYGCANNALRGVDLNRNHSFKWGVAGISSDPCSNIYPGPNALSEPEAQAIDAYGRTLFADRRGPGDSDPASDDTEGVMITLHSYGSMVLHAWGWTTAPAPNATQLATLGRKFGFYNGYVVGQGSTTLYPTSGDMDDWFYGTFGVPSYTFELGTAFFQSCSYFESNIVAKNLQALLYAFKAARRPYQAPAGPEVRAVTLEPATVITGQATVLSAQVADNRYAGGGVEPSQAVAAARYSIDLPAWAGGATFPLQASDGAFDEVSEQVQVTVPTTGLSFGRHLIFVEAQDANGVWGVPTAAYLTVVEASEGCTNLLANGGFESNTGWSFGSTPVPGAYVESPVYAGARAVRLGLLPESTQVYAYSTVYQRVTLPATGRMTLRYWERTGGSADGVDYRETLLLKSNAGFLATLVRSNGAGSETWQPRSFDVTSYRGQELIVYFNVFNDGRSGRQWSHIDQVELLACPEDVTPTPTPSPTATPSPSPTPPPTPGPTPTPSPTPTPGVCQELLVNGGFESSTGWQFGSTPARAGYVAAPVYAGSQATRLGLAAGMTNRLAYSSAYQRVSLPATGGQLRLTYWERPGGGDGVDYREVLLLTTNYSRLRTVERTAAAAPGDAWRQRTFDLSAFAGRTLVLYFNVYNDGHGTQMANYLDNVSVALCSEYTEAATIEPALEEGTAEVAADVVAAVPDTIYLDDLPGHQAATVALANRNPDGPPVAWQAQVDTPWLLLDATDGTTPATLTVTRLDGDFAPGIYQGRIVLTLPEAGGETVEVPVLLLWGMHERVYLPMLARPE